MVISKNGIVDDAYRTRKTQLQTKRNSRPKITVEDKTIIAVSTQPPLGSKLMGNEVGFEFEIGNSRYLIQNIY